MWRSFFLAVGAYCCILGVQALAIEKAVLNVKAKPVPGAEQVAPKACEISPPDWAPWSLMSGGAVVLIYSFTIPKRRET